MNMSGYRDIIYSKLSMMISCWASWSQFADYMEDYCLKKSNWNNKYEGGRIVMWDDINTDFHFKPSSADEQRIAYSSYYGGNIGEVVCFIVACLAWCNK